LGILFDLDYHERHNQKIKGLGNPEQAQDSSFYQLQNFVGAAWAGTETILEPNINFKIG